MRGKLDARPLHAVVKRGEEKEHANVANTLYYLKLLSLL